MKKILLIIPNLGSGGAQAVFRQQLAYLKSKHDVTACVFNWDGSFVEDRTMGIESLDVPAGKNAVEKLIRFFQRISVLRKMKRRLGVDLSISHLEGADYVNVLSNIGEKCICWIHGSKKHDQNIEGWIGTVRLKILMPLLYRRASLLATVSKGIEMELRHHVGSRVNIQTIYNGINIAAIRAMMAEPISDPWTDIFTNHDVIVTHSRLSRQKNLFALLNIFNTVKQRISCKLLLIGDGELREQLINHSNELALRTWTTWSGFEPDGKFDVYFLGQQSNPFRYLHRAKLYALTSDWEGFPLALCEAIVCGVRVVAADCETGPREILVRASALGQPLDYPVTSPFGMLMPLAGAETINLWRDLMIDQLNGPVAGGGPSDMQRFDLSHAMLQTEQVITQLLSQ